MGIGTLFAQNAKKYYLMRNFYRYLLLVLLFPLTAICANAQMADTVRPVKVAIFIPLYVDDAFNGTVYTLGKENLPKSILPGLEFYNGVMLALDSLQDEGEKVEVHIYDTKKPGLALNALFHSAELNNVGLIIAAITNTTELKLFADEGLRRHVPVLSATYPNYVGVSANPFFVLLNSSFPAHLQGIYTFMKANYASKSIVAITKKGATEDYIKKYITSLNGTGINASLRIKWVTINHDNVKLADFESQLDSLNNNVVFVASPLEEFGLSVVQELSDQPKYISTVVGMPTWDGIRELNGKTCENVEIVFSTPFLYYSQNPPLVSSIVRNYKDTYYSRPSDMVYKGFETTYHFTKLLLQHRYDLINHLSDRDYTLFNHYKIEPVKIRSQSVKPDLMENKHLYFVKKLGGKVMSIM